MKRVNRDHISEIVEGYLKRRNYIGEPVESNRAKVGMIAGAVSMASEQETSALGAINCASVTDGNNSEYEIQFNRLVLFVKDSSDKHKPTLMQILFAIFISIYIDMLVGGLKQAAHRFHQKNKSIFGNLPIYKSSMEAISNVVQKCDRDRSLSISKMLHSELGESKFTVVFPTETLTYLTNYLSSRENMMIMQVFNSNITVEIASDQLMESATPADTIATPAPARVVPDVASLTKLKTVIENMRGIVSPQPKIRLHSISSSYPRVNCGHVTKEHLVLGCNDSSIRLLNKNGGDLSLTPAASTSESHTSADFSSQTTGKVHYQPDVSKVHLNGDWLDDIEECSSRNRSLESSRMKCLRGHNSEVYGLSSFDESNFLISCSADKSIRLWDTELRVNKVMYQGHNQTIWSLCTAHRSSYFASASKDRSAKLWTTECTFPLRTYVGHTMSVDFHPNNTYLATASQDRTVRLWSVQEGKCVRLMQGHKGAVHCLRFSPNGSHLASAGEDRKIRLWDLASGELIKELKGHTDTIRSMDFNSDGSLLCSGGHDGTLMTWDTRITVNHSNSASGKAPATSTELLSMYSTSDDIVVSVQAQDHGIMEVVGVT